MKFFLMVTLSRLQLLGRLYIHRHPTSQNYVRHTLNFPFTVAGSCLPHITVTERTKQTSVDTQSRSDSDTKIHNLFFTTMHNLPVPSILIHRFALILTQTQSLPFTCAQVGTAFRRSRASC